MESNDDCGVVVVAWRKMASNDAGGFDPLLRNKMNTNHVVCRLLLEKNKTKANLVCWLLIEKRK